MQLREKLQSLIQLLILLFKFELRQKYLPIPLQAAVGRPGTIELFRSGYFTSERLLLLPAEGCRRETLAVLEDSAGRLPPTDLP